MAHPTIIYRIHVAIVEWKGNHSTEAQPQAIYLGVEEWLQLEAYVKALCLYFTKPESPDVHKTTFGGIPVLRVNRRRHLAVA